MIKFEVEFFNPDMTGGVSGVFEANSADEAIVKARTLWKIPEEDWDLPHFKVQPI